MAHWLVFVGEDADQQINRLVVCPNYVLLGGTAHAHWKPLNPAEPDGIRMGDTVWFFERGRGIDTLCEVIGPHTVDQRHPVRENVPFSFQWPVKVVKRWNPHIKPKVFGSLYTAANDGTGRIPVNKLGQFQAGAYCHRLPDSVVAVLMSLTEP